MIPSYERYCLAVLDQMTQEHADYTLQGICKANHRVVQREIGNILADNLPSDTQNALILELTSHFHTLDVACNHAVDTVSEWLDMTLGYIWKCGTNFEKRKALLLYLRDNRGTLTFPKEFYALLPVDENDRA